MKKYLAIFLCLAVVAFASVMFVFFVVLIITCKHERNMKFGKNF